MTLAAEPSVAVGGWTAWLFIAGAGCTALLAMWGVVTRIIRPMLHVGSVIEESFPVWVGIAKEFRDEKGGERLSVELEAMAANQRATAAIAGEIVAKVDAVRAEQTGHGKKLDDLWDYSHSMSHDIIGEVSKIRLTDGSTTTLVEAIVDTANQLRQVKSLLEGSTSDE